MSNLEVFCITNKKIKNLEELNLKLVGVGKDDFPENYINTKIGKNIQNKEKFYSELAFHYWFWKNQLSKYEDYIMKDSYFIQYLDNVKLHEDDSIVRIYGKYDDTIPINFLLFEDLSINISLKCK